MTARALLEDEILMLCPRCGTESYVTPHEKLYRHPAAHGAGAAVEAVAWTEDALHIHNTVAKKWEVFGDEDKRYLALAMSGEVGELLNLIKKDWRGDAGDRLQRIGEELCDVRIYLELLSRSYGFDLNQLCAAKIPELYERGPEAKLTAPPQQRSEQVAGGGGVDDAMVSRLCSKFFEVTGYPVSLPRPFIRQCLEAALSTQPLCTCPVSVEYPARFHSPTCALRAGVSERAIESIVRTEVFRHFRELPKKRFEVITGPTTIALSVASAINAAIHPEQAKDGAAG